MTDAGSQITRTCSALSQLPPFQTFIIQFPIAALHWSCSMVWQARVRVLSGIYSANSFSKGSLRTFPKRQKGTDGAAPGFSIRSESEFPAKLKHPEKGICREAEALFGGADPSHSEAGRGRRSGGGADSSGRDLGADFYRWKKQYVGLEVGQVRQTSAQRQTSADRSRH